MTPSIKPYSLKGLLFVDNQSKNKVGFSGGNLATKVEQKNKVLNVRNEKQQKYKIKKSIFKPS